MTIYQCDRCKKILPICKLFTIIANTKYDDPFLHQTARLAPVDVCIECLSDFSNKWLKEQPTLSPHSQSCASDNPSTPVEPSQAPQS